MLNRKMRGFGTILFDMVPKESQKEAMDLLRFGTILFSMVPKVNLIDWILYALESLRLLQH